MPPCGQPVENPKSRISPRLPTVLGKLGKKTPTFPQFHSHYDEYVFYKSGSKNNRSESGNSICRQQEK